MKLNRILPPGGLLVVLTLGLPLLSCGKILKPEHLDRRSAVEGEASADESLDARPEAGHWEDPETMALVGKLEEEFFPAVTERCAGCHQDKEPAFAAVAVEKAYASLKDWRSEAGESLFDFDETKSSRLYTVLAMDKHHCWSGNCKADARYLLRIIENVRDFTRRSGIGSAEATAIASQKDDHQDDDTVDEPGDDCGAQDDADDCGGLDDPDDQPPVDDTPDDGGDQGDCGQDDADDCGDHDDPDDQPPGVGQGTAYVFVDGLTCPCARKKGMFHHWYKKVCSEMATFQISVTDRVTGQTLWGPEVHSAVLHNTCTFTTVLGKDKPIPRGVLGRPAYELSLKVVAYETHGPFHSHGFEALPGTSGQLCGHKTHKIVQSVPMHPPWYGDVRGAAGPAGKAGPAGPAGPAGIRTRPSS